jgi:hypothetical protein
MSEPIFQIIERGRHIKIYANGVVEGIEGDYRVVNYIPFAITAEARERFSKRDLVTARIQDRTKLAQSP